MSGKLKIEFKEAFTLGENVTMWCIWEKNNDFKAITWLRTTDEGTHEFFRFQGDGDSALINTDIGNPKFKAIQQDNYMEGHSILLTDASASDAGLYLCKGQLSGESEARRLRLMGK